ncbi:MAG: hypothetical protein ACI4TD_11530 [Phocaeicola sp.]
MAVLKPTYVNGNLIVNGHIIARNLKFLGGDILHLHEVTDANGNNVAVNGVLHRIPVFTNSSNALGNSALSVSTDPSGKTTVKIMNSFEYQESALKEDATTSPNELEIVFANNGEIKNTDYTVGVNRIKVDDSNLCGLVKFSTTEVVNGTIKVNISPFTLKSSENAKCYTLGNTTEVCYIKRSDINAGNYVAITDHFCYERDMGINYTSYSLTVVE